MFKPSTPRIEKLAELFPEVIKDLEVVFANKSNVYIDWSNVIHWQDRLNWHIHLKRLKQLLDSFDTIQSIKLYEGTLDGNHKSITSIQDSRNMGYEVKTKLVKLMQISIDTSSIPSNSPALLQDFINKGLLSKLNLETIEFLNTKLSEFNKQGIFHIEEKKCNFDVEIGRDMLVDFDKNNIENFILWSGDSDFADPISQLVKDKKKVYLFATARAVSSELNAAGIPIFEIKKIKEFICWPKEIPQNIKSKIDKLA
jgi:uncharacterized LabA/DUF88 family protein